MTPDTKRNNEYVFSRWEKLKHLKSLETDWDMIYTSNPDLSPYQSFAFNRAIMGVSRLSPRRYNRSPRFFVFYGIKGEVRLIAPLFVRGGRSVKTVTLITDHMPAGCSDLIYPPDLTQQEFDTALTLIGRDLNDPVFIFRKVNQSSQLNRYIRQGALDLNQSSKQICVEISIHESYNKYWNSLRKSARDNITTSHNRLAKDGHTCEVKLLQGDKLSRGTIRTIMDIYLKRRFECEYEGVRSMMLGFSKRYLNPVTRALRHSNNSFCAILDVDGMLAAFCAGFERSRGRIVLSFLAIDSNWGRYSPGGLLITETMKQLIAQQNHTTLDLTRGDEAYKFRYGGKEYFNYDYEFRIGE